MRAGLRRLPEDLKRRHIVGMGILGGIGFTVSFFINNPAFPDSATVKSSKIAILAASVTAWVAGFYHAFRQDKKQGTDQEYFYGPLTFFRSTISILSFASG